ncbi:amidohydrolase [Streptomyces yaizuensis]|uniref:Amidohydrolase n=1 Tax=Streptomyces yaizuensis TaxID=2989713 RepID=A0ABQ5P7N5_9ACTN|nr:amidohydrolase [Streptomyces sp. YSPA8]GLF98612.1 amidohydrolase [Streptomyces sp. YSPA8]
MIDTPSLVDQHCHGVLRSELGLGTFEAQLSPTGAPPAPGTTFFDTQTGFAVRRWCPPLLGLEPHCAPARYLARRRELGATETARRLLRGSGIGVHLVDTGLAGDLTPPPELAAMAAAETHEIVRLEPLLRTVADRSGTVGELLSGLAGAVHAAAATAVAFAFSAVVRAELATMPGPPGPGEVRRAAGHWLAARHPGDTPDPVLLRHALWTAVGSGRPVQLHLGDADPMPLADLAAATAGAGGPLILLHGSPHHRAAARLTGLFPHVYADLGTALATTGARAAAVLAETLELAPFGKLLFSSGARGLPELHVVAARLFREAVGRVLGGWVADGAWSARDAERVAGLLAAGNARRVYGLTAQGPPG